MHCAVVMDNTDNMDKTGAVPYYMCQQAVQEKWPKGRRKTKKKSVKIKKDAAAPEKKKDEDSKCMSKFKYMFHVTEDHYDLPVHQIKPAHIWSGIRAHTTSHGIPHIDNARGMIKKGFWGLIFLTMVVFLLYNLSSLIIKFMRFDVDVIIQMQHERELVFPSVTICNMNPIRKSRLGLVPQLQTLFDEVEYVNSSESTEGQPVPNSQYPDRILARESFRLEEKVAEILADIPLETKQELGYQRWDLIWDCQYSGYDCYWQEFSTFYNSIHGNCFIFNSGWNPNETLKVSHKTGRRYGLKLILNIDQDEYVPEVGESAGVRVVVHPQSRMPFPQDEGIVVGPGVLTSIGLRQLTVSREPEPHGNCTDPNHRNITRNVFEEHFKVNYSATACYKTCLQRWLITKCGCGDPLIPLNGTAFDEGTHSCSSGNIIEDDCKYKTTLDFNNELLECSDCYLPCQEVSFQPELSTVQWPSDVFEESLYKKFQAKLARYDTSADADKYRRNILKLEVYYEEFNYENIDERPSYGNGQFASDIGGVLGLWIGWSFMTAFEFFELFLDLGVLCCVKRRHKKPNNTSPQETPPPAHVQANPATSGGDPMPLALGQPPLNTEMKKPQAMPPPYQSLRFV